MDLDIIILIIAVYQVYRSNKATTIIYKWKFRDDPKQYTYTHTYIMLPRLSNWFGFKLPKEKDFK